ncbi:MAG: AAA family ATPase [Alphaproteobacteria bacterium]|nr:AAA family ATPase [Alphaproteobacteria bacterium]MBR5604491.1 AAA family ATPase [Bacteroidales bacterium]
MADIICRWRNGTPKTVVELVNSMPHVKMTNADFREFMQKTIWTHEFFRTPYQLACQLGLYYESDDGCYYPRFDHDINEQEAKEYLEFWLPRYYVPNPYVGKNGFGEIDCPTYMLYELYKYAKDHPNCKYTEAYKAIFKEEANNNTDIVKNYINKYSKILVFDDDGNLSITGINPNEIFDFMDRNDKKAFFENFAENNYNKSSSPLQTIYYGTPGSGKSHSVKKLVKDVNEDYIFRTTFHPDSDYASFVGCYKPVMKDDVIKYEFCPQTFTKAYVKAWKNPEEQIYLIIEEINRGNCAQIFGDLFQLLDRKNGVSEYPIDADNDLKDYLEKELGVGHEGIANGKIKLPANLNIIATMNTSDQSLFPMDSAFKRRWSWKCVPVDYKNSESGVFTITVDDKSYNWHDFLENVNQRIVKATDSEDKQMGNFFITRNVEEDEFVDKVMFYLWNDVCKEEFRTDNNFFRNYTDDKKTESKEFTFNELFGDNRVNLLLKFMEYLGVEPIKTDTQTEDVKSEE